MGKNWRESSRHIWESMHSPARERYLEWCDDMQAWQDARDYKRSVYESLSPDEQRRRDIESGARVPLPPSTSGVSGARVPSDDELRRQVNAHRESVARQQQTSLSGLWNTIHAEASLALGRLRSGGYTSLLRDIGVTVGWTVQSGSGVEGDVVLGNNGKLYRGWYDGGLVGRRGFGEMKPDSEYYYPFRPNEKYVRMTKEEYYQSIIDSLRKVGR